MSSTANKEIKIAPGAVVCLESKLKGNITVGSMTVIHPKASLIAEAGPIVIGENNIIEEQASIIHKSSDDNQNENLIPLNIGVNNVFEVGCEIHAKSIGDHNVFEPKCFVGPDVEIGNGCIIGAGCKVTVAEKLPDQTVVTGRQCVRSVALDKPPGSDDLARQHDELTVLSEIFNKKEFQNNSTDAEACAIFQVDVLLPKHFMLLLSQDAKKTDLQICHLPPIKLMAFLPQDYPSLNPPDFNLYCCWLSKYELDQLVEELQKLWSENQCEILFIWCSFLKDQSLDFLKINDHYDLSSKCTVDFEHFIKMYEEKSKNFKKGDNAACVFPIAPTSAVERKNHKYDYYKKMKKYGPKTIIVADQNSLNLKTIEKCVGKRYELLGTYHSESINKLYSYLIEYNDFKCKEEFKKTQQYCNICFSNVLGELCKQLSCGHVACVECLERMCEIHIKLGTMESIVCSEENCGLEIPVYLIKELVSQELFERFDSLMLNKTLDKMANMTYCPRRDCQYPVFTQGDDSLAICPQCKNAFCIFCKRTYHGIEGCKLQSDEKHELIETYQNGDNKQRLELEKRYGKKQLTQLVNDAQSDLWLSQNCKKCPSCNINIEKNDGCNKMICRKCRANFCWICLTRVNSLHPYLHFQDPKSKCFNLLFEGTYDEDDIEEV